MKHHSRVLVILAGLLSLSSVVQHGAAAQTSPDLPARLNELGSENTASARTSGVWDVTETVWDSPTAEPTEVRDEVATRRMIGSMLEEAIHSGSADGPIRRIDDLLFNRVGPRRAGRSQGSRRTYRRRSPGSSARDRTRRGDAGRGCVHLRGATLHLRSSTIREGLDRRSRHRTTFQRQGAVAVSKRPAYLISARGGAYGEGMPKEGWDHATPWLRRIFEDNWGLDLVLIDIELTLAEVNPEMAPLRDLAALNARNAHTAARQAGDRLAARLAGSAVPEPTQA